MRPFKSKDQQRRRSALTLIECLVLVPLAGLAAAAAVALTGRSGQQDDLTRCLANLRTIGQASLSYAAEDSSEFYIPVPVLEAVPEYPGVFEWGGKAGAGHQVHSGNIASSYWGTSSWRGPAHRPLNRVLYRAPFTDWNPIGGTPQPGPGHVNYIRDTRLDLDVYRCPADTGYAGGGFVYTGGRIAYAAESAFKLNQEGLASAYDYYGTSYAANAYWAALGTGGLHSSSVYHRRLSSVPAPAHSVAYQEVPSRFVWMWGSWNGSGCETLNFEARVQGNSNIVPGWHGTNFGFNVGMADGHAEFVQMQGCIRPPPHLGSTSYPASQCSLPYDCFRCVTIRGPGWQLDTLPAEPVLTPWYLVRSQDRETLQPSGAGPLETDRSWP